MRRLLKCLSVLALLGFLLGGPAGYAFAGNATPGGGALDAGHSGHGSGKSHHEPVGHGPVHCLFASCVPTLFPSASVIVMHDCSASAGITVRAENDAPHSAVLERDPPVPRLPS
jgi:hypothetical protein